MKLAPSLNSKALPKVALATLVALPVSVLNFVSDVQTMAVNSPVTGEVPVMCWLPDVKFVMLVLGNPIGFISWLVVGDLRRPAAGLALLKNHFVHLADEICLGALPKQLCFIKLSIFSL